MSKFTITVWSHPDYEDLVAEVLYGDTLVALISQEEGLENLQVEFFPTEQEERKPLYLTEFEEALMKAKVRLRELSRNLT